ncbi:MAG: hypothetical protein ACREBG_01905 [Pyrinomonadaceae bacterium]
MKKCPNCQRTYSDESFSFCLDDGTLLSAAYDPDGTLIMTRSASAAAHTSPATGKRKGSDGGDLNFRAGSSDSGPIPVDDRVVAISINQQFKYCETAEELYQCTRGLWRLNRHRANNAKYAFAVYQGVVKEVYEIEKWLPGTEESRNYWENRLRTQGKSISPAQLDGRFEFIGKVAQEYVRKKYFGQMLPARPRGNPILYFNCR